MKKASILKLVKELPAKFEVEDLIERIIVLEKIEQGLKDAKEGKLISHAAVKAEFMKKWSK